MEITTKKLKLSQIKPNPTNPRKIGKVEMERLVKSLQDFPEMLELREIIVDENNTILGGNMRYRALKQIGEKECIAKIVTGLTVDQKREFIIKDNSAFGQYDMDALANLWSDLPLIEWGVNLPDDWLAGDKPEAKEDDFDAAAAAEAIVNPITKPGDVWLLGKHRVMCGDSTKKEDVDRLCGTQRADIVWTDPPYGMNLDTDFSGMEGISKGNTYKKVEGDDKDYDPTHIFNAFGYCKEMFLWGADYYAEKLPKRNDGSWIVWDKTEGGSGPNSDYDKMFGSNFELCWSKQKHKRALARVLWKGIFGLSKEDTKRRVHPTQKPVLLAVWFLEKFSKPGDIVADIFLGGGSSLIACEQLGRICYGMEIDPVYCDVIVKRWETLTGQKAVLES